MRRTATAFLILFTLGLSASAQSRAVTDSTALVRSLSATPADMIVGKVSGVIGGSVDGSIISGKTLNIRGINSLRSDNQPLFIVDGGRMSTDINLNTDAFRQFGDAPLVSPNNPFGILASRDIVKIEVIKDAAATALYGSGAANGVVLISTGPLTDAACVVDWSSNVGVAIPSAGTGASAALYHDHYARVSGKVGNSRYHISANFRDRAACVERGRSDFGGLNAGMDSKFGRALDFGFNFLLGAGRQNRTDGKTSAFDDGAVEYRGLFSAYANFRFAKMFRLENTVSADWMTGRRTLWYGKSSEFGRAHNVAASMMSASLLSWSARTALNFSAYVFSSHRIGAVAGAEYVGKSDRFNTLNGQNMLTEELRGKALNYMNYHFYPYAHTLSTGTAGPFATVEYDCMGYAGITAGARAEFAWKYSGAHPVVLPTASAYIDLRKAFVPDSRALSRLRLVGNLGASMSQQVLPYDFTSNVMTGHFFSPAEGGSPFFDTVIRLVTQEWTAGVETGFADGRVNLAVKYYDRRTSDRFSVYGFGRQVDVSGVAMWTSAPRTTVQQQESIIGNRGVELDFDALALNLRDASLKVYGTASWNANCLVSAEENFIRGLSPEGNGFHNASSEGYPLAMLYGYRRDGDGNPLDLTGEGEITDADKVILGSSVPVWLYSLGFEARWRGFSLETLLYGAAGYSLFNLVADSVEDASYLRLGRLGLSYDVPLRNSGVLKGLKVMAGAGNIFTITRYSGSGPDISSLALSGVSGGLDLNSCPALRTVTAGVTLRF